MHQTDDRTQRARRLRSEMTGAEAVLWEMLRGRRLDGLKFRRQAPVAGFVVDVFCPELRLVIERMAACIVCARTRMRGAMTGCAKRGSR